MKNLYILFALIVVNTGYSEVQLLDDNSQPDNSAISDNNDKDKSKDTKTSSQSEQPTTSNETPKPTKKVHAILDLMLGNPAHNNDENRIDIYVAPTCLHCGKFITEDLQNFLDKNSNNCCIRIRLLPVSAKDLFVMKLIQREARDMNGYYMIYLNYVKRASATFSSIKPTEAQKSLYKGSTTDPEMIKFQAIASAFGFSDEKIVMAYPNMDADYEIAVMEWYKTVVEVVKQFSKGKELELPLIIRNGIKYNSLSDIPLLG